MAKRKRKYAGFSRTVSKVLEDPAFGFSGMIEHLANHAHEYAREASAEGDQEAYKLYAWMRDQLDSLVPKARAKGL